MQSTGAQIQDGEAGDIVLKAVGVDRGGWGEGGRCCLSAC